MFQNNFIGFGMKSNSFMNISGGFMKDSQRICKWFRQGLAKDAYSHADSIISANKTFNEILCSELSREFERGYNPETPSNFWNNPKDSDIG